MIEFVLFALAVGVVTGVVLVARGAPENSLIGLNVATVCAVTALVVMQQNLMISFSKDIAFYLIFPGIFGAIIFSRFLAEAKND